MAFDFARLLTDDQRARIEATRWEMERLFALPDRFLARELLKMARQARAAIVDVEPRMHDPFDPTYDVSFLWHAVPEVAARLGETSFLANERRSPWLADTDGQDFRDRVGGWIQNVEIGRRHGHDGGRVPNACLLLAHDPCNGNPVAIALDRIAPPGRSSTDWPARHLREVGRTRFDQDEEWTAWTPTFQHYPRETDRRAA